MEAYRNLIEQFEEAKILIKRSTVASCRLSLILIDNHIELMLHERCESLFEHNSMYERLNKNIELTKDFIEGNNYLKRYPNLSQKEIRRIRNSFPEKVKYCANSWPLIQEYDECLQELHLARNSAYHRNETNSITMYVISLFYFRIAVAIFQEHHPAYISSTEKEWEYFYQRYGVESYFRLDHDMSPIIGQSLLADMQLFPKQFAEALERSVKDYVFRINEALSFLAENSNIKEKSKHYKMAIFISEHGDYPDGDILDLAVKETNFNNDSVESWIFESSKWKANISREEIFINYCKLEKTISPFLESIERMASDLDQAIQIQVDIARGK